VVVGASEQSEGQVTGEDVWYPFARRVVSNVIDKNLANWICLRAAAITVMASVRPWRWTPTGEGIRDSSKWHRDFQSLQILACGEYQVVR